MSKRPNYLKSWSIIMGSMLCLLVHLAEGLGSRPKYVCSLCDILGRSRIWLVRVLSEPFVKFLLMEGLEGQQIFQLLSRRYEDNSTCGTQCFGWLGSVRTPDHTDLPCRQTLIMLKAFIC